MLNDEVLNKLSNNVIDRINSTNEVILRQIGESIKKLGALSPSQAYELGQVMKYGGDYDKILKELSKMTKLTTKELEKIIEKTAKNDYDFAKQFYQYRNKKFIPYEENVILVNAVKAIERTAVNNFTNLSHTTSLGYGFTNEDGTIAFVNMRDAYNRIIDEAVESISQGKETFNEVMKRRINDISENGLRVIYENTYMGKDRFGFPVEKHYSRRFDSAVRMNISDAMNSLYNEEQAILGEQFESDGIEISTHIYPAPDHALMQGRQFSNEEYKKLNNQEKAITYDKIVIPADDHRRKVSTLNCQHYERRIILGISKPERTKAELKAIMDDNEKGFKYQGKHYTLYEGTQLKRKIELEIRKKKDAIILNQSAGNNNEVFKAQGKLSVLKKKYKEVSLLLENNTRLRV